MSAYRIFDVLYGIATVMGGIIGVAIPVCWSRAQSWRTPSVILLGRILFFVLPLTALFRLLSQPLEEQATFWLVSEVAVVVSWLAGGAAATFRNVNARPPACEANHLTMRSSQS